MKKIIVAICMIAILALIAGCSKNTGNSDEMTPIEEINETEEINEAAEIEEEPEERTAEENQALIEELMKEKGIEASEEEIEEEGEDESSEGNWTIEIIHMRGEPEKDLDISTGDSVTFISKQPNYVHRIQLRPKYENGAFGDTLLDPVASLAENESFTYVFEEEGLFQWYSKTNYPTTSGYITVE